VGMREVGTWKEGNRSIIRTFSGNQLHYLSAHIPSLPLSFPPFSLIPEFPDGPPVTFYQHCHANPNILTVVALDRES